MTKSSASPQAAASKVADSVTTRALVLGMVGSDGRVDAAQLYDVAEVCGYTVHQVRLCLSRLVDEGLLTQTGRGRKAVFEATTAGHHLLDPEANFLRLAWAQDAGLVTWDGYWHLVAFSIDEGQRTARNALRDYLVSALGGGYVFAGLYVSAHPWEDLVLQVAEEHGVSDHVLVAQTPSIGFGGFEEPREFAQELWPLDELGDSWQGFVERFGPVVDALPDVAADDPTTATATLGAAVRIATEFSAIIREDPLLPSELLPSRWPGVAARELMVRANGRIAAMRSVAGVPALYRRFDRVMDEVGRGQLQVGELLARPS